MASLLPAQGKILDGGSGHGLLSLTLALQSPGRQVRGIDHSPQRVAAAEKAAAGLPNLSYGKGDFAAIPGNGYTGIAFIDVLHYLDYPVQASLLRNSFRRLRRGGILLFRDVDRRPGLASSLNRLHESMMTRLGFTKAGGLHFRTGPEWNHLALKSGFKVQSKPTRRFPFADILFWCRKP
jgi:2-polyprenyl-3-methyl-5-hydroxy-6-metoxy-1,4-benzoquinol methylase